MVYHSHSFLIVLTIWRFFPHSIFRQASSTQDISYNFSFYIPSIMPVFFVIQLITVDCQGLSVKNWLSQLLSLFNVPQMESRQLEIHLNHGGYRFKKTSKIIYLTDGFSVAHFWSANGGFLSPGASSSHHQF